MTSIIYKQQLDFVTGKKIKIEFPLQSEILSCQFQKNELCIWYKFDMPDVATVDLGGEFRTFIIYGTGWEMDIEDEFKKLKHISTVLTREHCFAWHIFEIVDK